MSDSTDRLQLRALVTGLVQGVGYRAFVASQAARLGLSGTVANLPDGTVEVVAAGARPVLAALVAALREGPWGAQVDEVQTTWEEPETMQPGFRVTSASLQRAGRDWRRAG